MHQLAPNEDSPTRNIPAHVKRQLRMEVGFGCPIEGCGSPYLTYHHFDPEWHVEPHHDPNRMIALCAEHHGKAAAFTKEQLRAAKATRYDTEAVSGRFDWMRRNILTVLGSNLYYETQVILAVNESPVLWFERDDEGHMLLNLKMSLHGESPRTELQNNDWILRGDLVDVESPPNGSLLHVKYANGDFVRIRFKQWATMELLAESIPRAQIFGEDLVFPLVTAKIEMRFATIGAMISETAMIVPGYNLRDSTFSHIQRVWNVQVRDDPGLVQNIVAKHLQMPEHK